MASSIITRDHKLYFLDDFLEPGIVVNTDQFGVSEDYNPVVGRNSGLEQFEVLQGVRLVKCYLVHVASRDCYQAQRYSLFIFSLYPSIVLKEHSEMINFTYVSRHHGLPH